METKNLVLLFFILISTMIFSQEKRLLNITSPTPEASSLAKYVEIPIGYFNGVPQITIPLYEIVDKDIRIPITLNYHAGGFRVNEESSIVGLGWSLNVGGEITLIKRGGSLGQEDFDGNYPMPTSFDNENPYYRMLEGYPDGRYPSENGKFEDFFCGFNYGTNIENLDGERDLYIFNFHNYSGKFMFVRKWINDKIVIVPEVLDRQKIKFTKLSSRPPYYNPSVYGGKYALEAITEDGFIYKFDDYDYSRSIAKKRTDTGYLETSVITDAVSSYKLASIQSPISNRVVRFYYFSPEGRNIHSPVHEGYRRKRNALPGLNPSYSQFGLTESKNKYLDYIKFSSGTVKFHYSDRLDIYNGKKLDSIIVRDNGNSVAKRIYFNRLLPEEQKYFKSSYKIQSPVLLSNNDPDAPLFSKIEDYGDKRLKLKDVTIGCDLYQFKYNEEIILPSKLSQGMDYWGFYNGKENSTLLPDVFDLQPYTYVPDGVRENLGNYTSANRNPDAQYMQANILKTIIYPTKGETEFVYEPHSFTNSFRVIAPENITARDYNYETDKTILEFEIDYNQSLTGVFSQSAKILKSYDPKPLGQAYVTIQEFVNNSYQNIKGYSWDLYEAYNTFASTGQFPDGFEINAYGYSYFQKSFNITLAKGKYRIIAVYPDSYGFDMRGGVSIILNYYSTDTTRKDLIGGGLRISEIKDKSEDNKYIIRKYSYEGGVNLSIPNFIRLETKTIGGELRFCPENPFCNPNYCELDRPNVYVIGFLEGVDLYSSNVCEYSNSANGSYVGYKKVSIEYAGKEKGQSVYTFNISTASSNSLYAPRGLPTPNRIDIGLLTSEIHYKSDQNKNTFIPIRKIDYNYNTDYESFVAWNWIVESTPYYYAADGELKTIPNYHMTSDDVIHLYPIIFGKKLLDSKNETLFDGSGINTETKYSYNQDGFLKTESFINSSGKNIASEYRYPNDYNNAYDNWINVMKDKNLLKYPLEIVQKVGDKVVSGIFNEYYKNDSYNTINLINQYKTNISEPISNFNFSNDLIGGKDNHYTLDINYKYDINGNIVQITQVDNLPISFYWEANNSLYPIAKIEGLLYSDIESNSLFKQKLSKAASYTILSSENNRKELQLLNKEIRNSISSNLNIYTYTYIPLVGMTSMTDPSGITTYYDYDTFGRLKETYIIENGVKKVLQVNQYHYQNQ